MPSYWHYEIRTDIELRCKIRIGQNNDSVFIAASLFQLVSLPSSPPHVLLPSSKHFPKKLLLLNSTEAYPILFVVNIFLFQFFFSLIYFGLTKETIRKQAVSEHLKIIPL